MKTQTLFERPYVKICLDETIPAIFENWTGQVSGEEFQEILEKKLKYYNLHKKRLLHLQWLNDVRRLKGVTTSDLQWAAQHFHPKLYQEGIQHIAFVVPDATYMQLSDEQLAGHYDSRKEVQICYFDTFKGAAAWLQAEARKVATVSA